MSKGKKGLKKKIVDPFSRKEWYNILAPSMFSNRHCAKTLVNRTQGLKNAEDALRGRVFDLSQGDLNKDGKEEETYYRKFKLRIDEVQGKQCLTNFHGMELTSDRLKSIVRKWHTLIEAHMDVKTTDGYLLRLFVFALTKRRQNQLKKTTYAKHSQVRQIRKKMFDILGKEISSCDLKEVVAKLTTESIGREIEAKCNSVYPLQHACVRKVKILKSPKYDVQKLLDLHSGAADEEMASSAAAIDRPSAEEGFVEPVPSDSI